MGADLNEVVLRSKEIIMKRFNPIYLLFAIVPALFSCNEEDPGPRQNDQRTFSLVDFDRLEISEAMDVTVEQGNSFRIVASGDNRNLNDLQVEKNGSTLRVKFNDSRNRQYTTYVTITMPVILGVDFSGAVAGRVNGFTTAVSRFDLSLSGSSVGQLNINADEVFAMITGASNLRVNGAGKKIQASISGASKFTAFEYPVDVTTLTVSGASRAKVNTALQLNVSASGASEVLYRGTPQVEANVTGASAVKKD